MSISGHVMIGEREGSMLRMDSKGGKKFEPTGFGKVNCQWGNVGPRPLEQFTINTINGISTIESNEFPGVYLRMDPQGGKSFNPAGFGQVNCQYWPNPNDIGPWEKFKISKPKEGLCTIESNEFPGVYLRMDPQGGRKFKPNGYGNVNCQWGDQGPLEKFIISPMP